MSASDLERRAPVQGYSAGIPWSMHLRAYDAYCKEYSPQQALIEGGCRGGFGVRELDMFIPGWRDELSEMTRLKAALSAHEATIAELRAEAATFERKWAKAMETLDNESTVRKAAEARNAELERALAPFAAFAERNEHMLPVYPGAAINAYLLADDLRRARALSPLKKERGE